MNCNESCVDGNPKKQCRNLYVLCTELVHLDGRHCVLLGGLRLLKPSQTLRKIRVVGTN